MPGSAADTSPTMAAGGSIPLSISVAGFDTDNKVSVTIAGLPTYENITDALDKRGFSGSSAHHMIGAAAATLHGIDPDQDGLMPDRGIGFLICDILRVPYG